MEFQHMPEIYALMDAEDTFVAERVTAWLRANDHYDRWDTLEECKSECDTVFTSARTSAWLTDDQARYLALVHLEAPTGQTVIREPGEAEKLSYNITQVIIRARAKFRAYLPHIINR